MPSKLFELTAVLFGTGPVNFAWTPDCTVLASSGINKVVNITNRYGESVHRFSLTSQCTSMAWDRDGEVLAVVQRNQPGVLLWDINTHKVSELDTNMPSPTWLGWNPSGPILAIGDSKGNLLLYNKSNAKRIPVLGKHVAPITGGTWSPTSSVLALCSEDKTISLSKANGDTIDVCKVFKVEPSDVQFGLDGKDVPIMAASHGRKSIIITSPSDLTATQEIVSRASYGLMTSFVPLPDGSILAGFSTGQVVLYAALNHPQTQASAAVSGDKAPRPELASERLFETTLVKIVYNDSMKKAAVIGDNAMKLVDLSAILGGTSKALKVESFTLPSGHTPYDVSWSANGQVISVSTRQGGMIGWLTRLPVLSDAYDTKMITLTSLRELSIVNSSDVLDPTQPTLHTHNAPVKLLVDIEPSFVALGPYHVAVGVNNRVWYYASIHGQTTLIQHREYGNNVDALKLSEGYAAVYTGGRVVMHLIEPQMEGQSNLPTNRTFPDEDEDPDVTDIGLTSDFLIFSTKEGRLVYFFMDDWGIVTEYRHETGIKSIWPNPTGTRVVFLDDSGHGWVYNPVTDEATPMAGFSPSTSKVLWDPLDTHNVLLASDGRTYTTYSLATESEFPPDLDALSPFLGLTTIKQASEVLSHGGSGTQPIRVVASCPQPAGCVPIVVVNGSVAAQSVNDGSLSATTVTSHDAIRPGIPHEKIKRTFAQCIALGRLQDAWDIAATLQVKDLWEVLAGASLRLCNVPLAIRCYRQLGDAGMVMSLETVAQYEEHALIVGSVAMFLGDYDKAQRHFLTSSQPEKALEMRRDLFHWDQSLQLARTLDPSQIPFISRSHGRQLEFNGEHQAALKMFQKGLTDGASPENDAICNAGIARCAVRVGEIPRGLELAGSLNDESLFSELGQILESMKQHSDAGKMYVKARQYDRAAGLYISTKNFRAAGAIMDKIKSLKLHAQYAKAKEAEGAYAEAETAYETAKDLDSVVRLNLERLKNPQKAFKLVRSTRSPEAARLASKYCRDIGDFRAAVEFLLLAGGTEEAFAMAQSYNEMDQFAAAIGDKGQAEDYFMIARHYEAQGKWGKAGEFYVRLGDYTTALDLMLQGGDEFLDQAIEVVGASGGDEKLVFTLVQFLNGHSDTIPRSPEYVFKLYMALKKYKEAAVKAMEIAAVYQGQGKYKAAHGVLLEIHQALVKTGTRPSSDLVSLLNLLHSYVLAKSLVKVGDHAGAAQMLIRVSNNISKFPGHTVPILTSTVIECVRAGLKKSAFEFASRLMVPEYRAQINEAYKKKIENIVRRPERAEDGALSESPCLFCNEALADRELTCTVCHGVMPMCIASGYHMTRTKWSECPKCKFPARYEPFKKLLEEKPNCPMCGENVDPSALPQLDNGSVDERIAALVSGRAEEKANVGGVSSSMGTEAQAAGSAAPAS